MIEKIPTVSFWDSLVYNVVHVIPYYLQGIFTRNKFWVSFWAKVHPDPLGVKFVNRLRKKYQGKYFYIYVLTTKSLWVLDQECIKRVLDHSPRIYAEASLKRVGMSHFQPDAVTISRGKAWQDRRRFNDAVLNSAQRIHQYADSFLKIIRQATSSQLTRSGSEYRWPDFHHLFTKITVQILVGEGINDTDHSADLDRMMVESNRVFGLRKSRYFDRFYATTGTYLRYPRPNSLAALCRHVASSDLTRIETQMTHWMFAMKDTLAENTVRALALIVSHPDAEQRVREEMAGCDVSTPQGIDSLRYLEGCIQEAMRLWPTTPLLVRETVIADVLADHVIPPATQIVISNNFNHRDQETHPFADTFSPDIWLDNRTNYHFNHLSNGTQVCAGKDLALFIAKAVLATLLRNNRYALAGPILDPSKPIPYTYNYFSVVFERTPAG